MQCDGCGTQIRLGQIHGGRVTRDRVSCDAANLSQLYGEPSEDPFRLEGRTMWMDHELSVSVGRQLITRLSNLDIKGKMHQVSMMIWSTNCRQASLFEEEE